jgi:hypothetical protein
MPSIASDVIRARLFGASGKRAGIDSTDITVF